MITSNRLHEIHADPSLATPAEIQGLAETAHEFQRTRGKKTLRDEFAMAALNATLLRWEEHRNSPERMAQRAYEIADAMLKVRG